MNKKLVIKLAFSSFLLAIMLVGFATTAVSAKAAPQGCPTATCPTNLSGYSNLGRCHFTNNDGCVINCGKWRNNSTGALCKTDCWSH